MGLSKKRDWKDKGLQVINSHKGKRLVYESYRKMNPAIADEYVRFHAKQPNAVYVVWDKERKCFTT